MRTAAHIIATGAIATLLALPASAQGRADLLDQLTADLEPAAESAPAPSPAVAQAEAPARPAKVAPVRIVPIAAEPDRPIEAAPSQDKAAKKSPLEQRRSALEELRERQAANPTSGTATWFVVGFALLALGAAAWWLKRRAASGNPWAAAAHQMETLATHRISGKHQVSLVRVPGRVLVLGLSDKGVNLLTELDESDLEGMKRVETVLGDEAADEPTTFSQRLSQLRDRLGEGKVRDPFFTAAEEAPVDELVRLDERAAIRERLEALRARSVA